MTAVNLELTRTFEAPAHALYAAWTESHLLRRWWGPRNFTCPLADMDVRVGGSSLVCMRAPAAWGGMDMFNTWTYGVVEAGRRLEFVLRFTDASRNVITPQTLGVPPGVPAEVPHVLTFVDSAEGRSTFTITEFGYTSAEALNASKQGLEQTLEKLAEALRP